MASSSSAARGSGLSGWRRAHSPNACRAPAQVGLLLGELAQGLPDLGPLLGGDAGQPVLERGAGLLDVALGEQDRARSTK